MWWLNMTFLPWCRGVLISRVDMQQFALTDWDNTFIYNGATYAPNSAFTGSALKESKEITPNNMDVVSVFSDLITEQDILLRKFQDATIEVFIYNWMTGTKVRTIFFGYLGQVELDYDRTGAKKFTLKAQSLELKLQQKANLVTTSLCRHIFGDQTLGSCGFNLTTLMSPLHIITAIPDYNVFTVASTGQANEYYATGTLIFQGGILADTEWQVATNDATTFTLNLTPPVLPNIGDGLIVHPGCSKSITACSGWGNAENFGGFPYLPGTDVYIGGSSLS